MPDYEIDHGDDEPASARRRARAQDEAAADLAELEGPASAAEQAERQAAVDGIAEGQRQRHAIDACALALAGLCGQGLGGATRVEPWSGGCTLAVLAALGGLGFAGWLWRRSRHAAEVLAAMPVPLSDDAIRRLGVQDARRREAERQRRAHEYASIALLGAELTVHLRRIRLAAWGAGAGSLAGWACAAVGPPGTMALAASVAAGAGAVLAWRIAHGGWTAAQVQRAAVGVPAGAACAGAIAVGAPLLPALCAAAAVAGAAWWWRARISAWAGCAESVTST